MVDVARLGLAVDSSQVEKGTVSLHQLTGAAGQASAAAQRLAGASQAEAAGMRTATAATVAHTAAMNANNAAMRMANAQRTNLIFQLNDIGVSLASGMNPLMVLIQQGSQIATIYSGQGGVGMALKETGNLIGGLATRFAPLGAAVGAVSLLLYGFTRQINEANDANVSMVDTAIAMWESLASAVQTTLGPAFTAFGDMLNREIDIFTEEFTREANYLIGLSVGTVDALKAVWGVLPDAIGHLMFEMARGVSNTIVKMQMDILSSMNDLFSRIDTMAISLGGKAFLPRADVYGFGQANYKLETNPFGGAADAVGAAGDAFNNAMGQDYVGNWMKGIGARAQEIAAARGEMDALGGAASGANDNVKKLADDGLKSAADRAKELADNLGKSIGAGLRDLISGAKDFGQVMFDVLGSVAQFALQQSASLFGGMGGGFGFLGSILSGLFGGGFANGGVFNGGHVQPFARGGVVNGPTLFPMANGAGLMGEAGPEAIMPLRRGADGKLGVAANSNGSANIHVTVGVVVDERGNILPFVQNVARQEAQSAAAAGTQIAVAQANKTAPAAVAGYQKNRAGGDWRL